MMVPAECLEGLDLVNGWRVLAKIPRAPTATGANFSVGYLVENADGRQGFLKAMDYVSRLQVSLDISRDLNAMTNAFLFEREVLERCHGYSKVVTALEYGAVEVPNFPMLGQVEYLILEQAEGDVRNHLQLASSIDLAWTLRTLHQVAVGLFQMHRGGMAHQDLKPSNVLTFQAGSISKVGDLGCASTNGAVSPRDGCRIPGDPTYAPPEVLFGDPPPEWAKRRLGSDVYHLGSLASFFFSNAGMTPLFLTFLPREYHPGICTAPFRTVLPEIRQAFGLALGAIRGALTNPLADDIIVIIRECCEPDPDLRGDPKRRGNVSALALERYVARLNLLASKAEFSLQKEL